MKTHTLILIFHMILINGTLLKFRVKLYTPQIFTMLFLQPRSIFYFYIMSYTLLTVHCTWIKQIEFFI